jgi:hypothetical protein
MVRCYHGRERRRELLTANGAPVAPQIELLVPRGPQNRGSLPELLLGHLSFAAEGADRMKKLETVICEENQLIRNTARLISLHKLLSEHFIDGRRFIPKIGKFKLDEPYSAFEGG